MPRTRLTNGRTTPGRDTLRKEASNERPRRTNGSRSDRWPLPTPDAAPHPDPANARILTTGNGSNSGSPSLVARFFVSRPQAIHPSNPEKNRTPHARHYLDAACNYLDRPQNLPAAVYAALAASAQPTLSMHPVTTMHSHEPNVNRGEGVNPREPRSLLLINCPSKNC